MQPTGEISLRDLDLSSLNLGTPEDFLALIQGDQSDPTVLEKLSTLLLTPITLELASLEASSLDLIIPPLLLSVPFENLSFATPEGTLRRLGDQFQITLSPSILSLTLKEPEVRE